MRFFQAAPIAAAALFATVATASAEGWRDNTVYRSSGWSDTAPERRSGLTRSEASSDRSDSRHRRSRLSQADDGDRPQRRSRTVRHKHKKKHVSAGRSHGGGSVGVASYYWQPQRVASGGWFNPNAMTAAHKTLPFGTRVRVTHLGNGRSVTVTINDRGPYIAGRIIDLSRAAASVINMTGQGVARIQMTVLGR